ncbi:glycosyltransferase family 4 protein [Fodinisporobacter ferrooxydans]|uniref:Glycosyltransferase family 4 protein n=1 Tax=Fodinisporobacter ferrooxydans TaxID=2901836 RepID=A0ABY4CEZ1_9BACL|nr:glycosyltransferase family 4 protein [Alicyclobacillaceae bacterium MYW30-H2]
MRVRLVTPYYHVPRGNSITVRRIAQGLKTFHIEVEVVSLDSEQILEESNADLIHGFHAYRFCAYLENQKTARQPYIVTLTGTDLNYDLSNRERKEKVRNTLIGAKAVHVFSEGDKSRLLQHLPAVQNKTVIIPQGVGDFAIQESHFRKEAGTFVILLPAGIRKVKNIPAAISMLEPLHMEMPNIRLWICGPVIEEEEWSKVQMLIRRNQDWIEYIGQVPHAEMGALYRCADLVLNTSLAEGQPAALLEAMYLGIPVVASNIPGNRSILVNEETGLLYHDEKEFIRYCKTIMFDVSFKNDLISRAMAYVRTKHTAEKEIQAFISLYQGILSSVR